MRVAFAAEREWFQTGEDESTTWNHWDWEVDFVFPLEIGSRATNALLNADWLEIPTVRWEHVIV